MPEGGSIHDQKSGRRRRRPGNVRHDFRGQGPTNQAMKKSFILKNSQTIPGLGLGTWKLTGDECRRAVAYALEMGYRHIDTADAYGNQSAVGEAIKASGVNRADLFITSKIWPDDFAPDRVPLACQRILKELGVEHLDLLLMHWPKRLQPLADTLKAMNKLKEAGLVRALGVSNFTIHHLQDALATGVEFVCNQVEFHPSLNQKELKVFCEEHDILITAYSPLARGADVNIPAIKELAESYQKTPAQIILNWIIANGMPAIPKSASFTRIEENLGALDFELSKQDNEQMDGLNSDNRVSAPDFAEFDY